MNARIYAVGGSKYAIGWNNARALKVVQRLLAQGAGGKGRPRYVGVRGVRPFIGNEAVAIKPSRLLRAALAL